MGLDLVEVGGLGQTLSSGLLGTSQPRRVLLDSGPVLGPELDIVGVLVALNLGVSSKLGDVVSDPVQLILEGLGMGINTRSLRKKSKLSSSTSLEDLKLGGNVLLQIHCPGNTILREHSTRGRRASSVAAHPLRISSLAAMSSCRSIVLATRSSGSIAPEASLMSFSSAVAVSFHPSTAFRELSKLTRAVQKSSTTATVSLKRPTTSSLASTALISLSRTFFLSSGRVMDMQVKLSLMALKSPLMVLLLLLYSSCLFFRSERASSRLYLFFTFLISSSATSNSEAMVSLFSA